MTTRIETVGDMRWRCNTDPLPPIAARPRALMRARLVDEITGEPVTSDIVAVSDIDGLAPRIADGGIVGLVGQPARRFPELALLSAALSMRVHGGTYLPVTLAATLGPIAGFPGAFAPADLGDVELHQRGVALVGRTLANASPAPLPLGGASVTVTGIWITPPPPNVPPAGFMLPPHMVGLENPLYAPRAAGTTVQAVALTPAPAQERAVLLDAPPGATRVRLARRSALVAGTPLAFDDADPGRREIVGVAGIDVPPSDDQAGWITLTQPLRHLHRAGALAVPMSVPPGGASRLLGRAAVAGDCCAFLDALPPWPAGAIVAIDPAGPAPEFHRVLPYSTVSNGNGDFALPALSRVAMVRLRAVHGGMPQPVEFDVSPQYRHAQHAVTATFA